MKSRLLYWRCKECGSKHASDRFRRWHMDYCKCMESAVDAEEYYSRFIGSAEEITKEEYEGQE